MKVLRLKIFQETACYKKPYAAKVSETYPLPPFSTVKGMIHALLDAKALIPMKLCIQGSYDSIATDYQTHYFFKKNNTNEFVLNVDGLGVKRDYSDVTTMPIYRHMLYGVNLLIYVSAEESVLKRINEAFYSNVRQLSLGRGEDIIRVDECKLVDVELEDGLLLSRHAYVPIELIGNSIKHMPYQLNWTYRIIGQNRVWDKLSVGYMEKGSPMDKMGSEVYMDVDGQEEHAVFFHN